MTTTNLRIDELEVIMKDLGLVPKCNKSNENRLREYFKVKAWGERWNNKERKKIEFASKLIEELNKEVDR